MKPAVTAVALAIAVALAPTLQAQQPTSGATVGATVRLSLEDALQITQVQRQSIEVARAGVVRADGQRLQVRSQYFPQLNGVAAYTKTLQSQFSSFASSTTTTPVDSTKPKTEALCTPNIPANATSDQRLAALAQAASCSSASSSSGGLDLSRTSFGAKNQWNLGLNFSQNVYTGGRITAQNQAANSQLRSANIEVSAQKAQASLDVTSAYFDATLADQLVAIADSSLAQTDLVLQQTKLAKQVGNVSEYELLRAQVTRDNQLPIQIQARSNREVAYYRLKELLNMPLDTPVELTTRVEGSSTPTLPAIATAAPDTVVSDRAPVRQADEGVVQSEAQLKVAKSERIPTLSIVSSYQRLYFPAQVFPSITTGVNNWTVGLATSFPVLDGGRIRGDKVVAEAGVRQARAQREEAKQFAALDTRVALNDLAQATSIWEASRGTVDQAQRTYAIDEVRYREGISTQTDLTQSRLLLEQAKANRAQAARNYAVAKVRLALLKDLPLQSGGTTGAAAVQGAGAAIQQQQNQQQIQQQQFRSTNGTQSAPVAGAPTGSIQP
jgi:outer membrane protein TolC